MYQEIIDKVQSMYNQGRYQDVMDYVTPLSNDVKGNPYIGLYYTSSALLVENVPAMNAAYFKKVEKIYLDEISIAEMTYGRNDEFCEYLNMFMAITGNVFADIGIKATKMRGKLRDTAADEVDKIVPNTQYRINANPYAAESIKRAAQNQIESIINEVQRIDIPLRAAENGAYVTNFHILENICKNIKVTKGINDKTYDTIRIVILALEITVTTMVNADKKSGDNDLVNQHYETQQAFESLKRTFNELNDIRSKEAADAYWKANPDEKKNIEAQLSSLRKQKTEIDKNYERLKKKDAGLRREKEKLTSAEKELEKIDDQLEAEKYALKKCGVFAFSLKKQHRETINTLTLSRADINEKAQKEREEWNQKIGSLISDNHSELNKVSAKQDSLNNSINKLKTKLENPKKK